MCFDCIANDARRPKIWTINTVQHCFNEFRNYLIVNYSNTRVINNSCFQMCWIVNYGLMIIIGSELKMFILILFYNMNKNFK